MRELQDKPEFKGAVSKVQRNTRIRDTVRR